MKSRRVAKLLAMACMVTTIMSTPVFAEPWTGDYDLTADGYNEVTENGEGSWESDVSMIDTTVRVTVPTAMSVTVNPFFDGTATTTVSGSQIASKDMKIINRTYRTVKVDEDNPENSQYQGVGVLVTANAEITNGGDTNVLYSMKNADAKTFAAGSEKKNVYLQLQKGTLTDVSGNAIYAALPTATNVLTADNDNVVITPYGSKIQFAVGAPGEVKYDSSESRVAVSDNKTGKAALAVRGNATVDADWEGEDLHFTLSYKIKGSNSTITGSVPTAAFAKGSGTAGPTVTINSDLGEETVEKIVFHAPKGEFEDQEYGEDAYTVVKTAASGANAGSAKVTFADASDAFFTETLGTELKGKDQDCMVVLSDGRVLVTTAKIA